MFLKPENLVRHWLIFVEILFSDTAMALNTSMFEQNGQSGFVLKPAVMWDKSHMMYNHFNPMDKEFDGLHATVLTLQVLASVHQYPEKPKYWKYIFHAQNFSNTLQGAMCWF